jgi:hypothetical protein
MPNLHSLVLPERPCEEYSHQFLRVEMQSIRLGKRLWELHPLFQMPGIGYRLGLYDPRPDGQRFLINGDTQTVSNVPLTLVSNWSSELRK